MEIVKLKTGKRFRELPTGCYYIGGMARNELCRLTGARTAPVLDKDVLVVGSTQKPEGFDDCESSPSLSSFFNTRDVVLNQCALDASGTLWVTVEAIFEVRNGNCGLQQAESNRAALRCLRFAMVHGLQPQVPKYLIAGASTWDVGVQFLRANQLGFGKQFWSLLRDYGYWGPIQLPSFTMGNLQDSLNGLFRNS